MAEAVRDAEFESLLAFIRDERGFDFTGYKRPSLQRRISKRMQDVGVEDFAAYRDRLSGDGGVLTFRCRVGHQYGSDTFVVEQSKTAENSLWAALRLLEERAVLMRRLAERHEAQERSAHGFSQKAEELEAHAAQLTQLLREITGSPQAVGEV